jgi:hypothetical protein
MRFQFGPLPWDMLGRRPMMVTLTYPGAWQLLVPNARVLAKHREALKERWRRWYGPPIGVWVTEFQRRGAPHLHMYVGLPDEVSEEEYRGLQLRTMRRRRAERDLGKYEARRREKAPEGDFAMWLRTAWWEIVGSSQRAHHGRGVDIATAFFSSQAEAEANRARVSEYFWRESGKWAQKQPPEGFGSLAFYGRWGQKQGFDPVVDQAELDELAGLEMRRVLRRLQVGKIREEAQRTGWKPKRNAGRPRGRDGLKVFGVDGRAVGERLIPWAEAVAADKAAERAMAGPRVVNRVRPELLRAWSELPPPEPQPEEPWDPEMEQERWLAFVEELAIERAAEEEAALKAEIDAFLEEQRVAGFMQELRNERKGTRGAGRGGRRRRTKDAETPHPASDLGSAEGPDLPQDR